MRNLSKWVGIGVFLASTGFLQAQSLDCCPQYNDCCQMECCGCESNSQFYVEGAALIWKPSVSGIPFGVSAITNGALPSDVTKANICVNNVKFKWNAGFRAGVGYHFCAADAGVVWTHYHSTGKGCTRIPAATIGLFQSPWLSEFSVAAISPVGSTTNAFAKWDLKLNLIDVKFSKRIEWNNIAVTPFASVRGGWIQNRYNINVATSSSLLGSTPTAQALCLRSKFEGAGLRGGLEASYQICNGFGIYGFGSGSMLYGRYKNQANEFISGIEVFAADANDTTLCQNDRYNDSLVIGDCGAGIEYRTAFCNDRFALTLQAGWEQNVLYNEVQFTHLPSLVYTVNPQGDSHNLTLQGFTFTARLDF